jgi:hypothetical protein
MSYVHAPGGKPGQLASFDADGAPVWIDPPTQNRRIWCHLSKGPCSGDCYGSQCDLQLAHAPLHDPRPAMDLRAALCRSAAVLIALVGTLALLGVYAWASR